MAQLGVPRGRGSLAAPQHQAAESAVRFDRKHVRCHASRARAERTGGRGGLGRPPAHSQRRDDLIARLQRRRRRAGGRVDRDPRAQPAAACAALVCARSSTLQGVPLRPVPPPTRVEAHCCRCLLAPMLPRSTSRLESPPAVIFLEVNQKLGTLSPTTCARRIHRRVARHYNIPVISLQRAVEHPLVAAQLPMASGRRQRHTPAQVRTRICMDTSQMPTHAQSVMRRCAFQMDSVWHPGLYGMWENQKRGARERRSGRARGQGGEKA